jgi:hypothetical protein
MRWSVSGGKMPKVQGLFQLDVVAVILTMVSIAKMCSGRAKRRRCNLELERRTDTQLSRAPSDDPEANE